MISTTAEFNYSMISTTAGFNFSGIQLQRFGAMRERGVFIIHVCGHLPMDGSLYAGTCSG